MTDAVLDAPGVSVGVDALLALRYRAGAGADTEASTTARPGGFVTRRRGRGLEVADVRVFEDGDDVRHIDRNATARTGVPHVRTFREERDRTTLLIADFRAPMLWGTRRALRSVAAAEHLSLVGWDAVARGGRVALMAIGGAGPLFVPARGRERAMIAVIGGLARAHRIALERQADAPGTTPAPLDGYLHMAEQIAPRGASVVLASSLDAPGKAIEEAMTALANRVSLSVLYMRDAFERMPLEGVYPFETEAGRRGLGLVRDARGPSERTGLAGRLPGMGIPVHDIDAGQEPGTGAASGACRHGG